MIGSIQNQNLQNIKTGSQERWESLRKTLLTFISTKEAEKKLAEKNINTISGIILDERSKCFSDSSNVFYAYREHLLKCKEFAEYYGNIYNPDAPLGHAGGQYSFGFFYNTPDNTLPIFWATEDPIMKRHSKTITGEIENAYPKFN